ncbi:MAG: ABC transporter permease [Planctomycetales bacterium]|nr:ABC transporter permease [Planctomycetales bacterium]
MSTAEPILPTAPEPSRSPSRLAWLIDRWTQRVEPVLERWSEWLNPILVKESRQALKSRQFTITFTLLLVCAWCWSFLSVFMQMPDIYYTDAGLSVLVGYYVILAVPLLLVVPFTTFRSLAAEREDGTYELLSISTLTSRQIVLGKLNSALLQMMVYYSALAPCIAFTYMLRGVDILFIALMLLYTFVISVILSCIGLVIAGLSRSRHLQSLLSVVLLIGLIFFTFIWTIFVANMLDSGIESLPYYDWEFWAVQGALITAAACYIWLLIEIAAAQNSFDSDNRSTRIRVVMTVQTTLFVGWVTWGWIYIGDVEFMVAMMILAMMHWFVYSVFLAAESPQLSPRVRRNLPQTFLGRTLFTWYNPGSGSGYMFALSHVGLLALICVSAAVIQRELGWPNPRWARPASITSRYTSMIGFAAAYIAIYVGLGRLVYLKVPQRERYGMVLAVLIQLLVMLAGAGVPYFIEAWANRFRLFGYSPMQATNWSWTLYECMDKGIVYGEVYLVVVGLTILVLLMNLLQLRTEIQVVRAATPDRVLADDGHVPETDEVIKIDPLAP